MKSKTQNITISSNDKIGFISNFATMLSAGIPILEVVDSLLEDAKGNQKKILETLKEDISQGQHVYVTFSKFPKVFNPVTVQIIRASEEAGTLEETLRDLKDDIRREAEFADKVRSALIYPLFIFIVFGAVLLLMLTFVIPRIASVFTRIKVELPLPTVILINTSNIILEYKIFTLLGALLFIVLATIIYKKEKSLLIQILSSFPVISDLILQIDLTRFSRSLYLLLSSGIPINSALDLTAETVGRRDVKKAIVHCREMVTGGRKLSEGFRDAKNVIPSLLIKIVEAGERSGSLDKAMQDIAEYLDYQVATKLKAVTSLIEPIMLVVVGLMIGGMMLAIIAPIYGLISQIASR